MSKGVNHEKDVEKGKRYRKLMIICMWTGIALGVAGMVVLNFRRTALGILCFSLSFAILCAGCVFEFKKDKYPKPEEPEDTVTELSEEQLEALRLGKPAYNFSTSVMKRKVNIMGGTFIGVGLMFALTGLFMFWVERGHNTPEMMVSLFYGIIMLGVACIIAGSLLFTLKKHPQRAPLLKMIVLAFCIGAGIFVFVITDYSGATVFTDVIQVIIIYYAMDVVIKQGRIY